MSARGLLFHSSYLHMFEIFCNKKSVLDDSSVLSRLRITDLNKWEEEQIIQSLGLGTLWRIRKQTHNIRARIKFIKFQLFHHLQVCWGDWDWANCRTRTKTRKKINLSFLVYPGDYSWGLLPSPFGGFTKTWLGQEHQACPIQEEQGLSLTPAVLLWVIP